MPNEIVDRIVVENNRCTISIREEIAQKFMSGSFVYRCGDIDLTEVPQHILAVPFFLNIAPVLWKAGGVYRSSYLDPALSDALGRIRDAWRDRDGSKNWIGTIEANARAAMETHHVDADAAVALFSGGVDSLATSLAIDSERKALVLVRGNDIELENEQSWRRACRLASRHAERIGASLFMLESNMYEFINQAALDRTLPGSSTWWGSVQHGMGLAGLMAVPCWVFGATRAVIAATHSLGFNGTVWGSTPDTDELIRWADVRVEHHGYDASRQEKIQRLIAFAEDSNHEMQWRLCFRTGDGANCGECEKCLRTGAAIVLENRSPDSFGLPISATELVERVRDLLTSGGFRGDPNTLFHWTVLQKRARELRSEGQELSDARSELIALICGCNLEHRRAQWARKERFKTLFERLVGRTPKLEAAIRHLVGRIRRARNPAGKSGA